MCRRLVTKAAHARYEFGYPYPRLPRACDDDIVKTVLIVDDHPSFRASARLLLEAEGYDVVGEASTGTEAIERARELKPELVLLDVQLPDTDGFALAGAFRVNGYAPEVVLVSSRDEVDYRGCIERSGARGFIAKAELSGTELAALLG